MRKSFLRGLLLAAVLSFSSLAFANMYSYLGAWLPPAIYQTNTWYSRSAPFTGTGAITTIQWQLQWNLNNGTYGVPLGTEMMICDSANHCFDYTNVSGNGSTSYFAGEPVNQTFTFYFRLPSATTHVLSPAYYGYSANTWLMANYQ